MHEPAFQVKVFMTIAYYRDKPPTHNLELVVLRTGKLSDLAEGLLANCPSQRLALCTLCDLLTVNLRLRVATEAS